MIKMKLKLMSIMFCIGMCGMVDQTQAGATTKVYECIINGQHVFSDRACDDNATQRDVVVANHMDAVDERTLKKYSKPVKTTRHQASSSTTDNRRQQCAQIRKSKAALVKRMEAGYSAKQHESLHDRLRKLDDQYFELRCSGVAK